MTNKNYRRGYRVENRLVNYLKKQGYKVVARTAGSHSPVDVIGIDIDRHIIIFAQCKTNKKIIEKGNTKILRELSGSDWFVRSFNVWPDKGLDGVAGLHFDPITV